MTDDTQYYCFLDQIIYAKDDLCSEEHCKLIDAKNGTKLKQSIFKYNNENHIWRLIIDLAVAIVAAEGGFSLIINSVAIETTKVGGIGLIIDLAVVIAAAEGRLV